MIALDEAQSISDKDKRLLREVKAVVQRFAPSAQVILYGSVARGDREPESDYDILILTDTELSEADHEEMDDVLYDLELEYNIFVSTIIMTKREWAKPSEPLSPYFRSEINRDAVAL